MASVSLAGCDPASTRYVPLVDDRSITDKPSPSRTSWACRRETPVSESSAISGWMSRDWLDRAINAVCWVRAIVDDDVGGHGWSASSPFNANHAGSTSTTTTHLTFESGAAGGSSGVEAEDGGAWPVVKS